MSWDLNLCLEGREKVLVPFHHFCKPRLQQGQLPTSNSFPFLRLPVDLQLTVYDHCDTPTLFQLKRTCSLSRRAVTKRFSTKAFTDQWYYCPHDWLFEHETHTHVLAPHCPDFAARITKIEIDMIRLELRFVETSVASTVTKAKLFWAKVAKAFPSVKSIILTGCTPREHQSPVSLSYDQDYSCIETVVKQAPTDVIVNIAFVAFPNLERGRPPRKVLWQIEKDMRPTWRTLNTDWRPERVLLPRRRWGVSPLGDFQTYYWQSRSAILEMDGIQWLMIESYARYAVDDIHCPRLHCDLTFKEREGWKQHLLDSGHDRFDIRVQSQEDLMLQLFCYKHTPEIERLAIEERQQHLIDQYLEIRQVQRRLGYGFGPRNSEQRRLFEQEFIEEMQQESLFVPDRAAPGSVNPDRSMLRNLYVWFRHAYHDCSEEAGHECY